MNAKKHNTLLKSARLKKSWTAEFVSDRVGVSLNTYIRWEAGVQTPRLSSLDALCKVFEMSPEELGFPRHLADGKDAAEARTVPKRVIEQRREDSDEASAQSLLQETLVLWKMGLASCWQLYMVGGQEELERLVPAYLANLTRSTLHPGPAQKMAAGLSTQAHQLTALLALQRGDYIAAQMNGTQALVYSQLAKDWNLYIASQIRLAAIFSARKRIGSALSAYNDALRRVNAVNDGISPILHSWIFAGLGEIQAAMGREKDALQFLRLAFAVFPDNPEDDPCFVYAQCDRSMLFLYEGLIFLRLGQPKMAWKAFAEVDEMKPPPPERTRAEFLKHKAYTSITLGNMIQSCIYLEAAAKAAQEIGSDLAFSDSYALYEYMLALWGKEPRVRALSRLFQR